MVWLPMHSGHPLMVHLPLVSLPLAVGLDLLARRRCEGPWRQAASVLWGLGLLGILAAMATGLLAYSRVDHSDLGHAVMTLHRNLALAAVVLLLVGGVVRWRRPHATLAAVPGLLGLGLMVTAAYFGGELVFRHAIGLPNTVLEQVMRERGGQAPEGVPESSDIDSASPGAVDSVAAPGHDHRDTVPHSN